MNRHEFLRELHRVYRPRNYLEIGVDDGRSLSLSRVPSIAIDPTYRITRELRCDVQLVRSTSDAFFRRIDPLEHLRGGRNPFRKLARKDPALLFADPTLELSLLDGMHLFEFALRDFINVEKLSSWSSLIVLDDVLPHTPEEAARNRGTGGPARWTGDVYKVADILTRYRPDLVTLAVDTSPTGMLVVFGADPTNTTLPTSMAGILAEYASPDPQPVPAEVLERKTAVDPYALLKAPFWRPLVRARTLRRGRATFAELRPQLEQLRL